MDADQARTAETSQYIGAIALGFINQSMATDPTSSKTAQHMIDGLYTDCGGLWRRIESANIRSKAASQNAVLFGRWITHVFNYVGSAIY
jgi:hypothetical protein